MPMCIIRSFPDNDGDFILPARVFNPKPSKRTSFHSHSSYGTVEHSPRLSGALGAPPPPPPAIDTAPYLPKYAVPPPLVIQQYAPQPHTAPLPPIDTPALPLPAPLQLQATAQTHTTSIRTPPQSSPRLPPAPTQPPPHTTAVREPSVTPSTTRSVIPPPAPEAPSAVREPRHSRDVSGSSASRREHRPESRQSSAPRAPRSPRSDAPPESPRSALASAQGQATGARTHRSDPDVANTDSRRSHHRHHRSRGASTSDRASVAASDAPSSRSARSERERPHRHSSRRRSELEAPTQGPQRMLEPRRNRESIVFQNADGTRVSQFYYS